MLTKFAKPYEKSHEKNLNCFERYDALFKIKNNFQILVLGTPEGYPALDPFNFIKVDSKFGIMTQSSHKSQRSHVLTCHASDKPWIMSHTRDKSHASRGTYAGGQSAGAHPWPRTPPAPRTAPRRPNIRLQ